jgi:hypothetical protein
MVRPQPSKLMTRVRFPPPAPNAISFKNQIFSQRSSQRVLAQFGFGFEYYLQGIPPAIVFLGAM